MVDKKAAAPAKSLLVQEPTTTSVNKSAAPAKNTMPQRPITNKSAVPIKNPMLQAPSIGSVKKAAAPAKDLAAQAPSSTSATATAFVKRPAPITSSPGFGATSKNPLVKPPIALRPKPLRGNDIRSSPKNPAWEPHLSLKKAGFRVPIFRPRDT